MVCALCELDRGWVGLSWVLESELKGYNINASIMA